MPLGAHQGRGGKVRSITQRHKVVPEREFPEAAWLGSNKCLLTVLQVKGRTRIKLARSYDSEVIIH